MVRNMKPVAQFPQLRWLPTRMNFSKIVAVIALILALSMGQSKADFWSRLGKKIVSETQTLA